jgi:hypothetical protein
VRVSIEPDRIHPRRLVAFWEHDAMIRFRHILSCLAVAVPVFAALGCGGGHADFSGKVTYKGKPLYRGAITIVGDDTKILVAAIGDDGTFEFHGVATGTVRIGILCPEPSADHPSNQSDVAKKLRQQGPPSNNSPDERRKWFRIPNRYSQPETSGLTAEISGPATTKEIPLPD